MSGYSLRSSRQPPSSHSAGDRWTTEERNRLSHLRKLHSNLSWKQFHQLDLFPHRSQLALYREYMRMEQPHTRTRVQLPKDRSNGYPAPKFKRRLLPDPNTSKGRPDKQARIIIDDDEESNDDDGDIEDDGQTMPLQSNSLRSPQEHTSRSPDRLANTPLFTPTTEARPAVSPTQRRTFHPASDRPAVPAPDVVSNTGSGAATAATAAKTPQLSQAGRDLPLAPPTTGPAAQSHAMESHIPQSSGPPAAGHQTALSIPATSNHEGSRTPVVESFNTLNLSLPKHPQPSITTIGPTPTPTATKTPPPTDIISTTQTATTNPFITAQQNKPAPAAPNPGGGPILRIYKDMATAHFLKSAGQNLVASAGVFEHDIQARIDRENLLGAEAMQSRIRLDQFSSTQSALSEKLNTQNEKLEAQAKELEELKASRSEASTASAKRQKEIEELKASRSEASTATAKLAEQQKEIEALRGDILKLQETFHGFDNWRFSDIIKGMGMFRTYQESDKQTFPAGETG